MCTGVCPKCSGSFIAVLQHNPGLLFQPLAKIGTFYFLMSHLGFTQISKVPPPYSLLYSPAPTLEALLSQLKDGVKPSSAAVSSVP